MREPLNKHDRPEGWAAGRLALRAEGNFWVAYYAQTDTMEGALELGRIVMAAVEGPARLERKQMFMGMMRDLVGEIIHGIMGVTPDWPEPDGHAAPQHERAGRA